MEKWAGSLMAKHRSVKPKDCGSTPLQPFLYEIIFHILIKKYAILFRTIKRICGYRPMAGQRASNPKISVRARVIA